MKMRKKRKRRKIVLKGIWNFIPQEVYRKAVGKCFAVHLFFCGEKGAINEKRIYVLVDFPILFFVAVSGQDID